MNASKEKRAARAKAKAKQEYADDVDPAIEREAWERDIEWAMEEQDDASI